MSTIARKAKASLIIAFKWVMQPSFTVRQRSGNMDHREGQIEPMLCQLTTMVDASSPRLFVRSILIGTLVGAIGNARSKRGVLKTDFISISKSEVRVLSGDEESKCNNTKTGEQSQVHE